MLPVYLPCQDASGSEMGRMLGVPGMGDRSIPLEILGASPGSDAYDDPEAFLTGVAAERITILRILHAARLPLPDSALNALAGIDERRLLAESLLGSVRDAHCLRIRLLQLPIRQVPRSCVQMSSPPA